MRQTLNLACFTLSKINGKRHHFIMQLNVIIQKAPNFSSNIRTQMLMLRIGTMIHLYINVPIMVIWRFADYWLNMEPFLIWRTKMDKLHLKLPKRRSNLKSSSYWKRPRIMSNSGIRILITTLHDHDQINVHTINSWIWFLNRVRGLKKVFFIQYLIFAMIQTLDIL